MIIMYLRVGERGRLFQQFCAIRVSSAYIASLHSTLPFSLIVILLCSKRFVKRKSKYWPCTAVVVYVEAHCIHLYHVR